MENILQSILEFIKPLAESTKKLWKSSQFFRITSIVTASFATSLLARNIYIKSQRKYLNLPPGELGYPIIGVGLALTNPKWLENMMKYGPVASVDLGTDNGILFNNPDLAKKFYSNPRALDTPSAFTNPISFSFSNGKRWQKGRRIIYANLMSTMKASYVEDVTKIFIKTKLFPIFDEDIQNNQCTDVKPLFRPIGFNIVLLSCFGTELKSLSDPFWIKWDKQTTEANKKSELLQFLLLWFGNSKFSIFLQKLLTGTTFVDMFKDLIDLLQDYSKHIQSNVVKIDDKIKTNDVRLFEDYVKDYTNDGKTKLNRNELLGDMMFMFFAATDTTYSSLASAVLLAAKYPNIQEKLHAEIVNAFGNNVDDIELQHSGIFKIPLLRAFINETLRLYPPATIAGFRGFYGESMNLETLKYGAKEDYSISDKTITFLNIYGINKTPKYWIKDYDKDIHSDVNMNEVHLDFWLKDGKFSKKKNSASFYPFGTGKRDCVGQALAMKEMLIVLAMIFMKYKIESKSGRTDFEIGSVFGGVVNEPLNNEIRLKAR